REEKLFAEMAPLLPFAKAVIDLQESRRRMEPVDGKAAAATLVAIAEAAGRARKAVEASLRDDEKSRSRPSAVVGARAAAAAEDLRAPLGQWYRFHAGYDPIFSWWAADPFKKADEALRDDARFLRERVAGMRPRPEAPAAGDAPGDAAGAGRRRGPSRAPLSGEEPVIGDPIGGDGLKAELALEMIPYAPEELTAVADREFAWCEAEMKKAARDMGLGD